VQRIVGVPSAERAGDADGFADDDGQTDGYAFRAPLRDADCLADTDPDRLADPGAHCLADTDPNADPNTDPDPDAGILAGNRQSRRRGRDLCANDDRPGSGLYRHPDPQVDDLPDDRNHQSR
jgi:hypothetical protein